MEVFNPCFFEIPGGFWIIKNVIVSGCILYPVKSLCSDKFIWSNIQTVKNVSVENEAWTKGWPDYVKNQKDNIENIVSKEDYSKNFFWLKYWSKGHLKKILKIIIPYILALLLIVIFLRLNQKKSKKFAKNNEYIFFISTMFLASFFWFLKVPVFRYGYSYFISMVSLIFAYYCVHFDTYKINIKKIVNFFVLFCIITISLKNIIRITKTDNNYINYPWPKYFSMNEGNIKESNQEVFLRGEKFFKPPKNKYCMFSESPCANYGLNKDLKLIKFKNYNILYFTD